MSSDEYNLTSDDVICMANTSQIRGFKQEIIIASNDMEEGQLPKASCIRADKIYTLNQSIIVKKFGKLKQEILDLAFKRLEELVK